MIDIPFVMAHVHPDSAPSLHAHFITGHTASQKEKVTILKEAISECKYPAQITADSVYLSNPFGTHHTKMMVLGFDNLTKLQIVIHTANLISFDWGNMTQGAWVSPMLNVGPSSSSPPSSQFKTDFVDYLAQYKLSRTSQLIETVKRFDFGPVKAVLIGSAPGNYAAGSSQSQKWGLIKLRNALKSLPTMPRSDRIHAQVSSIASFGATDTYFTPVMACALNGQDRGSSGGVPVDIVFPTVENVKSSVNGYASGSSIHFKRQTGPQEKQLAYLRAQFCSWRAIKAGRALAAPHIKTYIRVSENADRIRWLLLTSANLSKQAWGNLSKEGNLWIQSFELGVLLHPALFDPSFPAAASSSSSSSPTNVHFIPTYKRDTLRQQAPSEPQDTKRPKLSGIGLTDTCVAIRMPYDLPVTRYNWQAGDMPWSPNEIYTTPDWRGEVWPPV